MFNGRSRADKYFALPILVAGIVVGLAYYILLWKLDENGLSPVSKKLPYWDFTNLWAGGRFASRGNAGVVFDAEAYRAALRVMFNDQLPDQEWSYPPTMLLLGVPLSQIPILPAYILWTLGTLVTLHFALRPLALPPIAHIACLLSPAAFMNALLGQNGTLTAALLIGGLAIVPIRPILAGILFGLLTVKPHLGLLVPICMLASQNYRAFIAAAVTAMILFLVTGFAFGFDVWTLMMTKTAPLMSGIMEAPYPQTYHSNAVTVFVLARWLGLELTGAYVVQAAAFMVCGAIVLWIWRPVCQWNHAKRVCLTAALAIIATPYGYSYDTIPMCVLVAFAFVSDAQINRALLAVVWLFPLFVHLMNYHGIGIGIIVPAAIVSAILLTERQSRSAPVSLS